VALAVRGLDDELAGLAVEVGVEVVDAGGALAVDDLSLGVEQRVRAVVGERAALGDSGALDIDAVQPLHGVDTQSVDSWHRRDGRPAGS